MKKYVSKRTVLKVDLLQDRQIYCLQACMIAFFRPEQAVAVKGLKAKAQDCLMLNATLPVTEMVLVH